MKTILLILSILLLTVSQAQTSWYEIPTGVDNKLNTIDFPSELVGYIGGNDTLLLKTIDGGNNWSSIHFEGVTVFAGGEHILDLNFIDENIGYMTVGPYGGTYKTLDGGLNWEMITVSDNLCYVGSNFFFGEDDGFIGGTGCFEGELIDIVSDGSTALATMNDNGFEAGVPLSQIDFLNEDYGLASSLAGRIFRTTDGGVTWDSIPSSLGNTIPITSIKIIDESLAYAGYDADGGGSGLLKSTDMGLSWSEDIESATFYYPAFYEIIESAAGHVYVATAPAFGDYGVIFEHNGTGWQYWNVDQPVYALDTYSDSIVWAVGDSGFVVVNTPPSLLEIEEQTTSNSLFVYPNPSNSIINLDLKGFNTPLFRIIDLQGRIIEEHVINTNQIDISHIEKGLYLIQVSENNEEITGRLVIE